MKRKREAKASRSSPSPDPRLGLLQMRRRPKPGETSAHLSGELLVAGLFPVAATARDWSACPFGSPDQRIDLTTTFENVVTAAERVNRGDLGHLEGLLTAQAVALNAMFVDLARRAHITKRLDYEDHYVKLAFKALSQGRATVETLAEMKNPPVFTRQANIATQQLVNNGTMVTASRARESKTAQNELSEGHAERLDGRDTGAAVGRDTALATVAALDRAADRRG